MKKVNYSVNGKFILKNLLKRHFNAPQFGKAKFLLFHDSVNPENTVNHNSATNDSDVYNFCDAKCNKNFFCLKIKQRI